jgi:uncharacterized protein (DUF433 family)
MTGSRITLDSSKRGGRPCIRNLRISVYDVLEMLAEGMSEAQKSPKTSRSLFVVVLAGCC